MSDLRMAVRYWQGRALFARRVAAWLFLGLLAEHVAVAIYWIARSFNG